MNISKKSFIESIQEVKTQWEHDIECSKAFQILLPHDYTTSYDNNILYKIILKLLKDLTNDENDWIYYYIYDLEFGTKYHSGMVKDSNLNDIELKTIEDLWNILNEG